MTLEAGKKLGPYKIVEPIGKGGMGEVYRARDAELDRDIAIKVLPPELAGHHAHRHRGTAPGDRRRHRQGGHRRGPLHRRAGWTAAHPRGLRALRTAGQYLTSIGLAKLSW